MQNSLSSEFTKLIALMGILLPLLVDLGNAILAGEP